MPPPTRPATAGKKTPGPVMAPVAAPTAAPVAPPQADPTCTSWYSPAAYRAIPKISTPPATSAISSSVSSHMSAHVAVASSCGIAQYEFIDSLPMFDTHHFLSGD